MIRRIAQQLGPQRSFLLVANLVLMAMAPLSGGGASYSGWKLFPTIIAPSLVPIMLFVVVLDILMSLVFMADKAPAERVRYRFIILVNLAQIAGLVVFWMPFFLALLSS